MNTPHHWRCHRCDAVMGTRRMRMHRAECWREPWGLPIRDPRRFECLPCGERMGLYATRFHRCLSKDRIDTLAEIGVG